MPHINTTFRGNRALHQRFGSPPNLSNQQFVNVQFIGVDFRKAIMNGTHFHDVKFVNCIVDGADFSQARLTGKTRLNGS
jgi:uncharacterized protein YjbI with pentapeptide repeats